MVITDILKKNESLDIYNEIFENAHEGIIIADSNKIIRAVNRAFSLITGYNIKDVVGKKPSFLVSNRHDKNFYKTMWANINKSGRWSGKIWNRRKNGEIFLAQLTISVIKKDKSNEKFYIGILSDISSSKIDQINKPNYDPLTNLPNRILFRDHLGFMLAHARRNNQIVALLLLDIDRFKIMNDTLGYMAGDMILVKTAQSLKNTLREVDAVFRLGNDEFAIILEEISKIEDAVKVSKKILHELNAPLKLSFYEEELYISASIGISIFPKDGSNPEELIKNSETAMYQAKEMKQNSIQQYSPPMNVKKFEHLTIEHQLHRALENNEFTIYYQPFINILTKRIIGAEALIRWKHPKHGLVPPSEFIPIAEETGLIIPIGEHVLNTACKKTIDWHKKGYDNFHIAVNLSARQFQQYDLLQRIENILSTNNCPPHFLELEITETIGMKNAEHTIKILNKLKEKGIRISIDDFGTGYSSLSYLKKFPIDTLKVDQSFVRDISKDKDSEKIISLIISMAHTLNLTVIAESVETEKQLDFLLKQNCDIFQGYLFSKPIPAEEFERLLLNKRKENI